MNTGLGESDILYADNSLKGVNVSAFPRYTHHATLHITAILQLLLTHVEDMT